MRPSSSSKFIREKPVEQIVPNEQIEKIENQEEDKKAIEETQEVDIESNKEKEREEDIEEPTPSKEPERTPPTNIDQPIASLDPADYTPNTILDDIIKEKFRKDTYVTTILEPTIDSVFKLNETVQFTVKGTTTAPPPYELIIYTNRLFDFDDEHPHLVVPLNERKIKDTYEFSFKAGVAFKKGLYYLIVQQKSDDNPIYMSRFRVE